MKWDPYDNDAIELFVITSLELFEHELGGDLKKDAFEMILQYINTLPLEVIISCCLTFR